MDFKNYEIFIVFAFFRFNSMCLGLVRCLTLSMNSIFIIESIMMYSLSFFFSPIIVLVWRKSKEMWRDFSFSCSPKVYLTLWIFCLAHSAGSFYANLEYLCLFHQFYLSTLTSVDVFSIDAYWYKSNVHLSLDHWNGNIDNIIICLTNYCDDLL